MKKRFPLIVKIILINLYLVFLAGSFVRMTGSGMGCPDWPKCFGYYIPPTSEEEITWQPNSSYQTGMIIVKDEALYVADHEVNTGVEFNPTNWEKYTKHNYAKFNKYHTWIEYINRLTTVVLGIVALFLVISAYLNRKNNKWIFPLAAGTLFLILVEAVLGKIVVDTNLKPTMITLHMVVGLIIIGLVLRLRFIISEKGKVYTYNSLFNRLLIVSVIFSLIQIAMGTQVRQFIDEQVKLHGFENKQYSLMDPSWKFYFHRSFTIAIVLVNFGMFYLNQMKKLGYRLVNWIMLMLFLETITGILMYYAEIPIGTQAVHLLSGALLFGIQFYLWLQSRKVKVPIVKQKEY